MPGPDLDSILAELRGEQSRGLQNLEGLKKTNYTPIRTKTDAVQDVKYNVHMDTIYDRLNDGTYVAKFDNYAGGIGNEDRLAKKQTGLEQFWHGATKAGLKTLTYAFDATVGTLYGIVNAIDTGSWEGLYDNEFSNTIDDWNKQLDYNLPNYYSDEQKSQSVLRNMGTVNFWANDVAGGLAFVGGALLPELAIAAVTGGASAPTSFAKIGFKTGTKKFLKVGTKKIAKEGVEVSVKTGLSSKGIDLMRGHRMSKIGEYTGEALKTGGFLVRTSNFEAGMEARHTLHDSVDEYLNTFKEINGRPPSFEEYSEFMDDAVTASNYVYGANMAILSVSNLAMFGSKFGIGINIGKKTNNFGNRVIGLGVKKTAGEQLALRGVSKSQKFLGNSYKILSKPAVEGLYEEGLQGVIGKTMQNYLQAKYDPEYEQGYGLWSSLTDAFSEQYTSKDGWKEMAIGMIIGMGAPVLQGQAPSGFGKNSRKSREKQIQGQIDLANKGQTILKNMDRANSMYNYRNRMETEEVVDEDTDISNTIINTEYIKTQEHIKTSGEIEEDFNALVDNMELSSEQTEQLGGKENAESYKSFLKENFARDAKNYRTAKSIVQSLGLAGKLKDNVGNIQEVGEFLTMNIMVGKTSLSKAENIAKQIDALVGTDGIFDHMEHYNNMSQEKKQKIENLKKRKRRLRDLKKLAVKYGQQTEGVKVETNRKLKPETIQKNYLKFSEKLTLTQGEIVRLEQEISDLSAALDLEFRAENMAIDSSLSVDPSINTTEQMITEMDRLNTYVESLEKAGKKEDAIALTYLMNEFKRYSDAHRQMNSDIRRMMDTNFFRKSKEGKAFKNTVLGRKYVMSDEFRELIRENDKLIDESLRKSGVRGYVDVETYVQQTLAENEELSEREKYRRESVIRTILGAERLRFRMAEAQAEYQEIIESVQEPTNTDPLQGDTVRLKKKIGPENKDLSNIDVINQMINDITEEIDALRRVAGTEEDIENLEARIEDLEAIEVEPELEEGDYNKAMSATEVAEEELTEDQSILLNTYKEFIAKEKELQQAKKEITDLKNNKKFKLISTDEYQRLKELTEKRQKDTINQEELEELDRLSDEIDQWLLITGTVVEGIRLSDLIRQKVVLEETPITEVENVGEVTDQEVIDQINISDKSGNVNYSYGQTFEGVTAVSTQDGIEISGISPEAFAEITGVDDFRVNKQGNVLITQEVQEQINTGGIVSILPTNKDLTTNYSIVLITRPGFDGELETRPLMSTFNADFNGEMNPDAIYDLENGDPLTLEVNPEDAYNQELLTRYAEALGLGTVSRVITEEVVEDALSEDTKYQDLTLDLEVLEDQENKATTDKKPAITKKKLKKQEAIKKRRKQIEAKLEKTSNKKRASVSDKAMKELQEELRRALVVRVKDQNGNLIAVLKAKRGSGIKSRESLQFEAMRDQIASNQDFIERLINTGVSEQVPVEGTVTTKRVFIGHPNFNFTKNEDGSISIESRKITQDQSQHIVDVGYVKNGKIFTKTKDKGIDTTFLSKSIKNGGEAKIPFIVITKGGVKFAYPVKIAPQEKRDLEEFRDIYESELNPVEKAMALNTYMAQRGIDIKEPGNSFTVFNMEAGNKFFEEKYSQLESMDYYNELSSWIDPTVEIASNVVDQASVNIDLSNPVHSPKVQMDFSGMDVEAAPVTESLEETDQNDKETIQKGSGVDNFLRKCK